MTSGWVGSMKLTIFIAAPQEGHVRAETKHLCKTESKNTVFSLVSYTSTVVLETTLLQATGSAVYGPSYRRPMGWSGPAISGRDAGFSSL